MPATELLCRIIGVNGNKLSREESLIIELELFIQICNCLEEIIKSEYKNYFRSIRFSEEKESAMLEGNLIRHIVKDILTSEEYSVEGIACYTQTPPDVICDVATGKNSDPSFPLARKIIELHRFMRPRLYREIMKKITSEYVEQD